MAQCMCLCQREHNHWIQKTCNASQIPKYKYKYSNTNTSTNTNTQIQIQTPKYRYTTYTLVGHNCLLIHNNTLYMYIQICLYMLCTCFHSPPPFFFLPRVAPSGSGRVKKKGERALARPQRRAVSWCTVESVPLSQCARFSKEP